jgi:hypothetical protein
MNVILQRYDDFYKKKFSGRSLTWQKNSSSCVLRANFAKGPINIHSSLVHTAVLLLFNDKASMSIGDIEQATGLGKRRER